MVVDLMGFDQRWRLPEPIRWLDYLHAHWDESRGEDRLPLADELFLGDLMVPMPHLLLAYHDVDGDAFRVEFAGAAARADLRLAAEAVGCPRPLDPVGARPELAAPGTALSWLGAGYASARRMVLPGAVHVRHGALVALHLPYADERGRVRVILSGIVRWPEVGQVRDTARVVPLRR